MPVDIGPRIGIDGEKQFRDELKNINQSLKTLDSEMKVVTSSFDGQNKSVKQLKKENDVLERSVLTLRDKLKKQEEALKASADKYGEADAKTMKWQQAVNETTAALNKAEAQIRQNNAAMNNFNAEADNGGKKVSAFGDTFKGVFSANLLRDGIQLAVDAIKKIGEVATETAAWADDINTLAAITGLSTQQLQEFQYMSDLVDVDVDTLAGSMSKLTKNMNTARKGTGDAATAFEKLGIEITDNNGELRNNKEVFFETITALSEMTNETERDAAAMAIFGKSAQDLNPLILAGSDAMKSFAKEAADMGLIYSDEELGKLNDFNDEMYKLKQKLQGLKTDLVLVFIDDFSNAASKASDYVSELREQLSEEGLGAALKTVTTDFLTSAGGANSFATILQDIIDKIRSFPSTNGLGGGIRSNIDNTLNNLQGVPITKPGATVNIYPQTMSQSEYNYILNGANTVFGGAI